mmetsp:Transcript_109307/g.315926  ORF Transcript_109307/g.315926 Transcript_109307/m.315926 type:complete len:256 (-) Transcript_109307:266-1033(-)
MRLGAAGTRSCADLSPLARRQHPSILRPVRPRWARRLNSAASPDRAWSAAVLANLASNTGHHASCSPSCCSLQAERRHCRRACLVFHVAGISSDGKISTGTPYTAEDADDDEDDDRSVSMRKHHSNSSAAASTSGSFLAADRCNAVNTKRRVKLASACVKAASGREPREAKPPPAAATLRRQQWAKRPSAAEVSAEGLKATTFACSTDKVTLVATDCGNACNLSRCFLAKWPGFLECGKWQKVHALPLAHVPDAK